MKEIYRKASVFGFICGGVLTIICILYYFNWYEGFSTNGDVLIELGIGALFSFGAGFYLRQAYQKLKSVSIIESVLNFEEIMELTLKRVPGFLPKVVHVDSSGQPRFMIVPKRTWARYFLFLEVFEKGLLFPVSYVICEMDGSPIATFWIKNTIKQVTLSLEKTDGEIIGYYIQRIAKSVMVNRGTLYHFDGSIWRQLEAKNMAGDIDITDEKGSVSATYRYGRFPYATSPAFVSTAYHDYVRFGPGISTDEKLAYTMIFFYWLCSKN